MLKKDFNIDQIKLQIQQIETKKTEINQKIRVLNSKIQQITLQSNLHAKIEHLQNEAKKAEDTYKAKYATKQIVLD
jgi:chromosome segregation ATPase